MHKQQLTREKAVINNCYLIKVTQVARIMFYSKSVRLDLWNKVLFSEKEEWQKPGEKIASCTNSLRLVTTY